MDVACRLCGSPAPTGLYECQSCGSALCPLHHPRQSHGCKGTFSPLRPDPEPAQRSLTEAAPTLDRVHLEHQAFVRGGQADRRDLSPRELALAEIVQAVFSVRRLKSLGFDVVEEELRIADARTALALAEPEKARAIARRVAAVAEPRLARQRRAMAGLTA